MKILLLFLILFNLLTLVQTQTPTDETAPMSVSSYKWTRARQAVETELDGYLVNARVCKV